MRILNSQWSIINRGSLKIILLIFTIHFLLFPAFSQKISATVDRDKILIGQQITLQIKVSDADASTQISQWFNLPDSFNHFEIIKRSSVDTININGSISYLQKIILTSFDSGYWQIPALTVSFNSTQKIITDSIAITVLPVDVSSLKDYHDIKDIIEVKKEIDWLFISGIAATAIISALLIYFIIQYFRKRKRVPKKKNKSVSIDDVLKELDTLQQKKLEDSFQHKLLFTELINLCRAFSDEQLQIYSADQTTDEYILSVKNKIGIEPVQVKYFQLLRLSDAVKFAKFIPAKEECKEAFANARTFVQTIYQYTIKQNKHAE